MATTTRQEESAAEVVKTESIEFLLEPVSFRNGGARLTPQDKAYLGEVAAVLKQTPKPESTIGRVLRQHRRCSIQLAPVETALQCCRRLLD
jgi:outer membrane protein OmpA-like peptidoglycan-associated protein